MQFRMFMGPLPEFRGATGSFVGFVVPPSKRKSAASCLRRLFAVDHPLGEFAGRIERQRGTDSGELYVAVRDTWPSGLSDRDVELARAALVSEGFVDMSREPA